MYAINVEEVSKTYDGEVTALDNVSINIDKGDFYGLIGKNGAGKTTLINILTGQIPYDSGDVSVLEEDVEEKGASIRDDMGILPENESPLSFLTPREYFEFVGDVRDIPEETIKQNIDEWVERLELEGTLDTLNRNLSQGQQQKVMVTATFLHEPSLVFIDEPLVNLDPLVQNRVKEFLTEYNDAGNTIILSTHYTEAAAERCSCIGVMDDGSLISEHDVDELSSHDDLRDILIEGDTDEQ